MLEKLLSHLRGVAPDRAEIDILQPADPFLETAGEALRRRIFLTESADGDVLCLRPEFTIPICLYHLNRADNQDRPRRYAYGGTVFRQVRKGALEFLQCGLEDIGNTDLIAADTACLRDLHDTLAMAGITNAHIDLGDQSLFEIVVENLQLPAAVAQRLMRGFGSPQLIEDQISRMISGEGDRGEDTPAADIARSGDRAALIQHIEQCMDAHNLSPSSGRSPAAIADRMIEKIRETQFRLSDADAELLRTFLAIQSPLQETPEALERFATKTGIDFGAAGAAFGQRVTALAQAGVDHNSITYKASFGRGLEYYTGLLFEARVDAVTIGGGGRYDRLCSLLGARQPLAAVGFSLALDRVEAAR